MERESKKLSEKIKAIKTELQAYKKARKLLSYENASYLLALLVLEAKGIKQEDLSKYSLVLNKDLIASLRQEVKNKKHAKVLEALFLFVR